MHQPSFKQVLSELRHPRTTFSDRAWQAQLPVYLFLIALAWTLFDHFIGDRVILRFLPKDVASKIQQRKKTDPGFKRICKANGTAFFHALLAAPICLATLWRLNNDHFFAQSRLFDACSLLVGGYFVWDFIISLIYFKTYGPIFFIHATLSLTAILVNLTAKDTRSSWIVAAMMGTEVSTPFLHLRWFLIKAKCTDRLYFLVINCLFIATYVGYRLIGIEWIAIIPYTKEVLWHKANFNFGWRAYYNLIVGWIWVVMSFYWGYLLAASQIRQFLGKNRKRQHTE